jgi:benzodiazapine receptor
VGSASSTWTAIIGRDFCRAFVAVTRGCGSSSSDAGVHHRSVATDRQRSIGADVLAFAAPFAAGALGTIPTAAAIPTWYRTLDKPSWNPPAQVFGPVWTTLYALMAIAILLVRRERRDGSADRAQAVFGLQLALNLAWSFVFFGGRSPRGGVVVIGLLWASIVATIAEFWPIKRSAALLLVPYLGWVSFASALNTEIARRNR